MTQKNLLLGFIIVVCLAVSAYRVVTSGTSRKAIRRDLADEVAAFVAKEAAAGAKGSLLILAPMPDERDPFPKQLAVRAEKHMRAAGFDPIAVERVPYNTALESSGEPVTRETFREIMARHEGVDKILTLVGLPRITASDLPAGKQPRIIVASTVIMPYLRSLPPGLIDFALEVKQDTTRDTRADPALGRLSENFVLQRYAK